MPSFYKIMEDLPGVPDHTVSEALLCAAEFAVTPESDRIGQEINYKMADSQRKRELIKDGQISRNRPSPRKDYSAYLGQWVNENITTQWSEIGLGVSLPADDVSPSDKLGPHSDGKRNYVLIYLLEISNPDQYTVWYQEHNQPIYRPKGVMLNDFGDVVELERVCMPVRTWVYIDGRALHGVENIQGYRTAIHIGFESDPFDIFPNV